ncbi:glycerophosphodiester phosphodiesterase [Jatrophihabitans fulvus]
MRTSFRLGAAALAASAVTATLVSTAASSAAPARPAAAERPGTHATQFATPTVFGHRGAAGYRPEHTAIGYRLGAQMGADYLEPDLVPTKDGVLVDRHEPEISQTTNVASHPEFADRKRTVTIDGAKTTGWFTFDFTLKELRTLRAVERIPAVRQHNTLYNGIDRIPTFQEDIDQVRALSKEYHRTIGIVPEIKHSTFFRSIGLPMEGRFLAVMRKNGLLAKHPRTPAVLQSFEVSNLQYIHRKAPGLPLVQLTSATGAPADFVAQGDPRTYADITSARGLKQVVARYATWLGPDKAQIVPVDATTGKLTTPTSLVTDAHRAGLKVVPYTFRNENSFLPADFDRGTNPSDYGNAIGEDILFFELGIDGIFTDNPDTAVEARRQWIAEGRPRA